MKPRLSRGTHTFELPIILTQSAQDYRVLAVAYIVPPIVTFVVKYGIVKPLLKRSRVKKVGGSNKIKLRLWPFQNLLQK